MPFAPVASPHDFDPELMFSPLLDESDRKEELTRFYLDHKQMLWAEVWADGTLDGDEHDALFALWAKGDPIEAYRLMDALMSRVIEDKVQYHLTHGTEPRGF